MSENIPEGRFPFGKEARRKEIEYSRDLATYLREREKTQGIEKIYTTYDSPLEGIEKDNPFDASFWMVLPQEEHTLRSYIENALAEKRGTAIGIEFGGPGSALFAGFSKGFFERSLGVTLVDTRSKAKNDSTRDDEKRHHSVLESDITMPQTYEPVRRWLNGRSVDLIIERLEGAHQSMPEEPFLIGQIFNTWYQLLAEKGVILAQTSFSMRPILEAWVKKVHATYPNTIEIDYQYNPETGDIHDALRLRKLPGAPNELPMLDPRTVREISKKIIREGV